MRKLILNILKAKFFIPIFLAAGILYTVMLTITIPKVMIYSGGMKILDMMPAGYDAAYVQKLMNTLGPEGRHTYLFNQIPLDLIYPLLLGISLCLIIAYLIKKLGKSESILFYLCTFPLFSALFDYLENFGIIAIINSYPNHSNILAGITNVFSLLKSTSTTICFLMITVLFIVYVIQKLRKTNINTSIENQS